MIVLKHLSKEYNIEPLRLRQLLRSKYGFAKKRRWRWNEDVKRDREQLARIRAYLDEQLRGTKPSSK